MPVSIKGQPTMSILSRRKRNVFIELLIKQAEYAVEGLQTLLKARGERAAARPQRVSEMEKEADGPRRILIDELNRTFVTPLDREDIYALSLTVEDILDYANTTIEEMALLDIQPTSCIEPTV